MKEKIEKIIKTERNFSTMVDSIDTITKEHYLRFVQWLLENCDIGNYYWDIGDSCEYSSSGIYQYWLDNINKE